MRRQQPGHIITNNKVGKKIILAGGSGFTGKAVVDHFHGADAEFVVLGRSASTGLNSMSKRVRRLQWDGIHVGGWALEFEGADAVINLAGKSVDCRYTGKNRKEILRSRLDATTCIGKAIRQCKNPPKVWINAASATIYRHAEDRPMDETTGEIGKGFSVEVCKAWEKTFGEEETPGTRKALLRMAIVLGKNGGVMKPLSTLVRFGLGGKMGNGKQYFSWIHEKDLVKMIAWIMENERAEGVFNCSAPGPVPNATLMRLLRKHCGIPFGLAQPRWMLEFGAWLIGTETELILKSRYVLPQRATEMGFRFEFEELDKALEDLLKK
jgi:uncharacterized protein (TIGR01777 family)